MHVKNAAEKCFKLQGGNIFLHNSQKFLSTLRAESKSEERGEGS